MLARELVVLEGGLMAVGAAGESCLLTGGSADPKVQLVNRQQTNARHIERQPLSCILSRSPKPLVPDRDLVPAHH